MQLPRIYNSDGFTLIEILTVVAISTILGSIGFSIGINGMHRYFFSLDVMLMEKILLDARNAATYQCRTTSLSIHPDNSFITSNNTLYHLHETIRTLSGDTMITFNPCLGYVTKPITLLISDTINKASLTISSIGGITRTQ